MRQGRVPSAHGGRHFPMTAHSQRTPKPGEGKTYSLFGDQQETDGYYDRIRVLADSFAEGVPDLHRLLESVQKQSSSRRRLSRLALQAANDSKEASLIRTLRDQLSHCTVNVSSHLRGLTLAERWDRVLATSEEQYHHYMLEVELVNRLNAVSFSRCEMRLAFLPHCLHDQSVTCKSVVRGEDHVCKGCSKTCMLNAVSKLLRRHRVTPYIWMTANLRSLLRRLHTEGKTVAVLGIACIPELVRGMRTCMRAGVPVIGLPLDANRCARWWGQFYPNSANLQELERLLLRAERFDDC